MVGVRQAFDGLMQEAYPALDSRDWPCAFATLAKDGCSRGREGRCLRCANNEKTPNPVPADAVQKVKAACTTDMLRWLK